MTSNGKWASAIIAVLVLLSMRIDAATQFGDVVIHRIATPRGDTYHGYSELRFSAVNGSNSETRRVSIILPDKSYGGSTFMRRLSRTLEIPAGRTVTFSLWQPPVHMNGNGIRVIIDGKSYTLPARLSNDHGPNPYRQKPVILASASIYPGIQEIINRRTAEIRKSSSYKSYKLRAVQAESAARLWSPHWLSYSCFDVVMMTRSEWGALPTSVRTALWTYVRCGGVLQVFGEKKVIPSWAEKSEMAKSRDFAVGFGLLSNRTKDNMPVAWDSKSRKTRTQI